MTLCVKHVLSELKDKFDESWQSDDIPEHVLKITGLSNFSLKVPEQSVDILGLKNGKVTYVVCFDKTTIGFNDLSQYVLV